MVGSKHAGIRYTLDCGIHARLTRPGLKLPSDLTTDSVVGGRARAAKRVTAEEYRELRRR